MNWTLFIDDERMPPWHADDSWLIARSFDEVKNLVADLGMPCFVSFDHDLGKNQPTGMDIAKWLVDQDLDGIRFPLGFDFYVHSQNPVGKKNIEAYLHQYLMAKD